MRTYYSVAIDDFAKKHLVGASQDAAANALATLHAGAMIAAAIDSALGYDATEGGEPNSMVEAIERLRGDMNDMAQTIASNLPS